MVKEVECKHRAWLFRCCRKPTDTEKLDTRGDRGVVPTKTVLDAGGCDTGNVENGERYGARWHRTTFSLAMTKLIGGTKIE